MLKRLLVISLFLITLFNSSNVVFSAKAEKKAEKNPYKITINLASTSLTLFMNDEVLYEFPVAVGKVATPTPCGKFKIYEKEVNPTWQDPKDLKKIVESGPANPLGYRWMGFWGEYGMHGTNAPWAIGSYVSNGCVRMHNEDSEIMFDLVPVGTPVVIYYDRVTVEVDKDNNARVGIYPDSYGTQPLSENDVKNILVKKGVYSFVSDDDISDHYFSGTWETIPIGKAYPLEVNDLWLSAKLVEQDGKAYLPVKQISQIMKVDVKWNEADKTLTSIYGTVPGYDFKNYLFVSAQDAEKLFNAKGTLTDNKVFSFKSNGVSGK